MGIPPLFLGLAIVVLIPAAVLYLFGINKRWGMLLPYVGMLLFASMSLPMDWNDRILQTFWLPIQRERSGLYFASGIAALTMLMLQFGRLRGKSISISALLLVSMGFYGAFIRLIHGGPSDGLYSMVFAACTLIPLMLMTAVSVDEPDDFLMFLRTTVLVNIIWLGMTAVQIVVNPSYVTLGNQFRFVGILNNPQHSGALLAFLTVFVLWLLLNDPAKKYKLIYIAVLGIDLLCLVWTGSRTGIGMAFIGISAVLYTKAGRGILMVPIAALAIYIGLKLVVNTLGIDFGVSRLASTENTRDYAWWKLYTTGMENPLFGVGTLDSEKSENSWLFGFAAYGIGMLGLSVAFTVAAMWECLRLIRTRYWLPLYLRPYSDLIVGAIAMYFAGAVLEGYMVSRVNTTLCLYLPIATAGALFRTFARRYHESGFVEGDSMMDYGDGYASDEGYEGYEES